MNLCWSNVAPARRVESNEWTEGNSSKWKWKYSIEFVTNMYDEWFWFGSVHLFHTYRCQSCVLTILACICIYNTFIWVEIHTQNNDKSMLFNLSWAREYWANSKRKYLLPKNSTCPNVQLCPAARYFKLNDAIQWPTHIFYSFLESSILPSTCI